MEILAIDPSVNHIGVAYTPNGGEKVIYDTLDLKWGSESAAQKRELAGYKLTRFIKRLAPAINPQIGIIEYPNFQVSTRGVIAAQKGYTLDLAYLAGYITAAFPSVNWLMPTPNEWKGQQPKEAIGKKFGRWLNVDYREVPDHAYEAAMMIKWYLDNEKQK